MSWGRVEEDWGCERKTGPCLPFEDRISWWPGLGDDKALDAQNGGRLCGPGTVLSKYEPGGLSLRQE